MKAYFPALTGLRAVAAVMVVVFHMAQRVPPAAWPGGCQAVLQYLLQWHAGVAIFFVLSGFLIAVRYAGHAALRWAWVGPYLQNRFARIYPLYALLTLFTFAVMAIRPTHEWWEWPPGFDRLDKALAFALNLTLLRAYFERLVFLGLPTAWSLTVEATFYACAPLLLRGARGHGRRLILYPVLLALVGVALVAGARFFPRYGLLDSASFLWNMTFFGHATEFVLGMALGLRVAQRPGAASPRWAYTALGAAGLVLYLAAVAAATRLFPVPAASPWAYWPAAANNLVLPLFVASLLWGLVHERTRLRTWLETPLFALLGKSSYALYLIHLGTVDYLFRQHVVDYSPACLVAYVLASVALYQWVERPLHARWRAAPAPSAQP